MKIALCGPLGAGCSEVAELLSAKFNLRIENTSSLLTSFISRLKEPFIDLESFTRSGEMDVDQLIRHRIGQVLDDNVIVEGRSGFMLLDRKDVIRVLLVSPREHRAKHVAERRGISTEEGFEDVQRSDEERRNMVERLFKKDWLDATNYDLVVNTSSMREWLTVADLIAEAVKILSKR
ncbi:MAG: cytidylate kinase family protein [Candidatus Bathyarchaeia archaeon]